MTMALAKDERAMAAAGKGCLGKAADDEPVFILRAQDMLAPALVEQWANDAERHGCSADKVSEARALARLMRRWPTSKYPD
jgi:hypothetical protein